MAFGDGGLWEVIMFGGGFVGETFMMGLVSLSKEEEKPKLSLSLALSCEDTVSN